MAHAVDTMMWTGKTPWHGLGKELATPPASGREALVAAGLDWDVELKDLRLTESNTAVTHKAVVRADRNEVLGVVGPGYRPYQNSQMAKLYDPLIQDGTVSIETAGSLQDGKRVWMLGRLKGDMDITGTGDIVRKYLMLAHGHDGSLAVRFGFTPIRVVCANTLSAAIGDDKSTLIKCLHTTNLDNNLKTLRNAMVAADETFELTAEEYRKLAARGVSRVELKEYCRIIHEIDKETDANPWTSQQRAKVRETQASAVEGTGNDGRTWWAAYNGATEWLCHQHGRNQETRLNNAWLGGGPAWNAKALELALQMSS
jgi:phage/plasmid-like protein (TIGR03299 family)